MSQFVTMQLPVANATAFLDIVPAKGQLVKVLLVSGVLTNNDAVNNAVRLTLQRQGQELIEAGGTMVVLGGITVLSWYIGASGQPFNNLSNAIEAVTALSLPELVFDGTVRLTLVTSAAAFQWTQLACLVEFIERSDQ